MQQFPKTPEEVVAAFPARPELPKNAQGFPIYNGADEHGNVLIEARADKVMNYGLGKPAEPQPHYDPIQGFDVDVRFHGQTMATAIQLVVCPGDRHTPGAKAVNKAYVEVGMAVVDVLFYDDQQNIYRFVGGPQGFDTIFTFNGKQIPGVTKIVFEAKAGKAIVPLYWWTEDGLCHRLINGSAPEVVNLPEPTEGDRLRLIENSVVDNPEETVAFLNDLLPPSAEEAQADDPTVFTQTITAGENPGVVTEQSTIGHAPGFVTGKPEGNDGPADPTA